MIGDLSAEQIAYLLKRVRAIAAMPDTDALAELDGLLWLLTRQHSAEEGDNADNVGGDEDDLDNARGEALIEKAERTLADLRGRVASGTGVMIEHYVDQALESVDSILQEPDRFKLDARLVSRLSEVRDSLDLLRDEADVAHATRWLEAAIEFPLTRYSSVEKVLNDIARCVEVIQASGRLTDEQQAQIDDARTRCAWFRARRTLDSAEVARAGGNEKKYQRLRAEAAAQLRQDWKRAFGKDNCPDIPT